MRFGGWFARGLLVVAGLAVGAALVEVGARLLERPVRTQDLRALHVLDPDADWLYRLRPGGVAEPADGPRYAINALGFRDGERTRSKPPGTFRALAIGDSVTFGWGVERRAAYPARLEAGLRASGVAAEVWNLGIGGYNPYTESALLREVAPNLAPDLVLVQFCINDLADPTIHFDNHARTRLGTLPDEVFPDPAKRTHDVGAPTAFERVCLRSRVCARAYDVWLAWRQARLDEATRHAGARAIETTSGPEWDWLERRYAEMAATARSLDAEFAILLFPHFRQLQRGDRDDPVQRRLVRLARDAGWPVVDLLPPFLDAPGGASLLLDYWHPSARGHALAARAIERQLRCNSLVPGTPGSDCPGESGSRR